MMKEQSLFQLQGETLRYFQRVIYALKSILIRNISEENKLQTSYILKLPLKKVIRKLRNMDLSFLYSTLTDDEIKVLKDLLENYIFVVEKSHLEYVHIIDPSYYQKKLDYVISRTEYIKTRLITVTYKLESCAFETVSLID